MQLKKLERKRVKIKLMVGGASGSGKTYGAMLMAKGLASSDDKVCIIDSENDSASIYDNLGDFQGITIDDFAPDNYIKAIDIAVKAGMEVIIIDSITHSWEWCVAYHGKMSGNSFQNWGTVLKMYDKLKNKLLQAPVHIITTVRKKEEMTLETVEGKSQVVKKGMKSIDRSEMSYEYTIVFDVDANHMSVVSKDRTGLFVEEAPFFLSEQVGNTIKEWALKGNDKEGEVVEHLNTVRNLESLEDLKSFIESNRNTILESEDLKLAVKSKNESLKENN